MESFEKVKTPREEVTDGVHELKKDTGNLIDILSSDEFDCSEEFFVIETILDETDDEEDSEEEVVKKNTLEEFTTNTRPLVSSMLQNVRDGNFNQLENLMSQFVDAVDKLCSYDYEYISNQNQIRARLMKPIDVMQKGLDRMRTEPELPIE